MLNLTENAQTAVRTLTQEPRAPASAGLRIMPGNEGLKLMLVAEPVPGDALIDDGGARVSWTPRPRICSMRRPLMPRSRTARSTSFLPLQIPCPRSKPLTIRLRHDTTRRV